LPSRGSLILTDKNSGPPFSPQLGPWDCRGSYSGLAPMASARQPDLRQYL